MDLLQEYRTLDSFSAQEAVEFFLAIIIAATSLAFLAANVLGYKSPFVPLSVVFYSVMPVSIAIIAFLTYKVAKIMYKSDSFDRGSYSALITSLLLAVVSLNIGFVMVILSGPSTLGEGVGMFKMSFLIVMLSLALSISVISRNMTSLAREDQL